MSDNTNRGNKWLNEGLYLPDIMRDFHDQKDIFKTIHDTVDVEGHSYAKDVSWIAGQCYVVDIFLWFMAKRGYTLQRSRMPFEFRDIHKDVAETKAKFATALGMALSSPDRGSSDLQKQTTD